MPARARYPYTVVAGGSRDTSDVSTVAHVVPGIRIVVHEVVAACVPVLEVRVVVIYARVHDGDLHVLASTADVPATLRLNLGDAPLPRQLWVVGGSCDLAHTLGFRIQHVRVVQQA